MSAERIRNAMDRIERALARIETQAALASHSPAPAPAVSDDGPSDGQTPLAARHAALRARVGAGIAELDRLIEGLER